MSGFIGCWRNSVSTLVLSGALAMGATACSKSGSGDTGSAPTINSVASLPKSTGKVTTASGVRLSRLKGASQAKATTGLKLSAYDSTTWTDKSRGLCEIGQVIRDAYREAGHPDQIQCYVGVMEKYKLFTGPGIYKLSNMSDEEAGGGVIKYDMTKDADGNISNFKLWSCMTDATKQDNFIEISLAATTTIKSVSKFAFETTDADLDMSLEGTFLSRTSGEGTVDNDGNWTKKTITSDNRSDMDMTIATLETSFTMSQHGAVEEYSDAFDVNAYWTGSMTASSPENSTSQVAATWSNTGKAMVQRINSSDSLSTLAMGDGSVKFKIDFDYSMGGTEVAAYSSSIDGVTSWNGDTLADLEAPSSGDYYSKVSDATLLTPAEVAASTVAFAGDEIWDCSGTATEVDFTSAATLATLASSAEAFAADFAECDSDYLLSESNWVDCKEAEADTTEASE